MNLDEFAAAAGTLADRAEEGLARDCAEEAARDYLTVLRAVTPKRTGHLMDSETVDSVTGSGAYAEAVIGAHAVYAAFREHGGTITRHLPRPHVLGNPAVGFFGRGNPATVTQRGSRYFEKARAASGPAIEEACRSVLAEFLTL